MSLFRIKSGSSADDFIEANTSAGSNEGDGDEVDGARGLQVDLSNEFVAVDHIASVVSLIADHEVVGQTATCLDFAEEATDCVREGRTSDLIVQIKEDVLSEVLNLSFDGQEQTANVDSVESGRSAESSLVTEQNSTATRECGDRVDSVSIELISLQNNTLSPAFMVLPCAS